MIHCVQNYTENPILKNANIFYRCRYSNIMKIQKVCFDFTHNKVPIFSRSDVIFTREYTKYTAGFTICFVVVVVVRMEPHYFGRHLIKHDQT
jgi:hypothetical protein